MLDDVDNVTNTWDDEMVGLTWTMTSGGLSSSVTPEQVPDDLPSPALPATPPAEAPATTPEPSEAPSGTSELRTYGAPDLLTAVVRRT